MKDRKIKQKTSFSFHGKKRFIKTDSITGKVISVSPWSENLIMLADELGLNLILRRLGNDLTYDIIITSAEIGTGNVAPADGTTDLTTPIVVGITPALQAFTDNTLTVSFFIPSVDLPNGTYKEFLLRCGTKAFAMSLITPNYTKGTNENTTVEYLITASNV